MFVCILATDTQPNSNVAVSSETSTSVTLSWAATPLATNYRISYISQDNAGTGVLNSPAPASVVSGLQPQTSYIFSVVATVGNVDQNVGSAVGLTTTGKFTSFMIDDLFMMNFALQCNTKYNKSNISLLFKVNGFIFSLKETGYK